MVTANQHQTDVDRLSATVTGIARAEMGLRLPAEDAALFRDKPGAAMACEPHRHAAPFAYAQADVTTSSNLAASHFCPQPGRKLHIAFQADF